LKPNRIQQSLSIKYILRTVSVNSVLKVKSPSVVSKLRGGCYALPTRHCTGNALQKFVKHYQSLKQSKQMCFELALKRMQTVSFMNCCW